MMLDSKSFRGKFENADLEELLGERDRIIDFMHNYENHQLPNGDYLIDPNPEVQYIMHIEYLAEICDLIKIRMEQEEFFRKSCNIVLLRYFDELLSKLSDSEQKEALEKLKNDDKKFYDEFMEWKIIDC